MKNIKVWTDGATSKNGSDEATGGYAFLITNGDAPPYYCFGPVRGDKVTNNVCELAAVMLSLQLLEQTGLAQDAIITVYTDSAYIANCFKDKWYLNWEANGWVNAKKKPVENRALWERILVLYRSMSVIIEKTKGHANDPYNNMVDKLARQSTTGRAVDPNNLPIAFHTKNISKGINWNKYFNKNRLEQKKNEY